MDPSQSFHYIGSNPGSLSHITIFTPLNLQSTVDALASKQSGSLIRAVRACCNAVLFDTDSGIYKSSRVTSTLG